MSPVKGFAPSEVVFETPLVTLIEFMGILRCTREDNGKFVGVSVKFGATPPVHSSHA
jgi:hypothetical protein